MLKMISMQINRTWCEQWALQRTLKNILLFLKSVVSKEYVQKQ